MKKMIFVGMALLLAGASVFAAGSQQAGGGGKPIILKMSTQLAETSPMVQGFKAWAEAVKQKTNGGIEIQIYPSAQLGSDEDVIEQALQGVNVAVLTDGGRMANYVKDIGIVGMPYIANNYDELKRITETKTFASWDPLFANEGIHILAYNWYDGPRNFYTNKPISTPADLAGVRIRTPGAPVWSVSVAALGATPIAMPWNDSYNALQNKSIDGVEAQSSAAYPLKIQEVTKYLTKTEHFQLANFIMVGEKWFQTLSPEYQKILADECKAAAASNAQLVLQTADGWEKEMASKGLNISYPDKTPFIQASEKAYTELGFKALRDQIWAEIGK